MAGASGAFEETLGRLSKGILHWKGVFGPQSPVSVAF